MSATSPFHELVHARFREAFGEPNSTLGKDNHWSLLPSPHAAAINVVVDGGVEKSAVWVFDPHAQNLKADGVIREFIANEDELNDLIKRIQDRVKRAASPSGKS